ncbi:hypothetical protein HYPSUDRAFT_185891 [Hypholoma sublateritium FD-334 SS-4]|uniref:Uncharacterized protein n=1 Tax=Hypholoma sublateritium (strain FD-334 SS-4) TaxID=945553 RepID=A0A0D2MGR1_HYPSF|nr:hypothetical protein HYPSUDRAFT_185891 [Hypholoma sublateritium FD-334 SS-4]
MTDIVTALGPGKKLDLLTSFAPDYVTVRRAFNDLLVFPHLEAIEVADASKINLLSLVTDGNSRFSELSSIDIELARKVISYDATLSTIIEAINIQLLVMTLQPVAQEYADHARAESETNLKFFADFTDYIGTVDERIVALDKALAQLDEQIQTQSEALANKNIVSTLWEVLKTLYKLASTAEESDVQIAAILGVTVSTVAGSFRDLFDDQFRLQRVISSLKGLRTRTQDLKTRFVALSAGLKAVSSGSKSLLDVWDDVAARMVSVAEDTNLVTPPQAAQLTSAWAKVAADAKEYVDILQQTITSKSTSAVASHRVLAAKFNAIPKVPLSAAEIRLYKLAAAHGIDVFHSSASKRLGHVAFQPAASNDEKVVEAVLGPPADTQKRLEDLADSTGRVIDQFNVLLQQPYLDQYKCTSPVDGSDSDLYTVMNYYRNDYLKLQQDTLPVARDLRSYAELQASLLPLVVPDPQAQDTDISMSAFIATNVPVVEEFKDKATALSDRSTKVKNDWDNVVNLVNKLIAECNQNITTFNNSINELTEQQRNMILYACLAAFGAFLAFTAAVFLPGFGMLVALGIGGALGSLAVYEAIAASKITVAINDLRAALSNAENTKKHLQDLLPYVTGIAASLSSISLIWSDIATALSLLDTFYGVLNGPTGTLVLNALRPKIISNWVVVQEACDKYIKTVSS